VSEPVARTRMCPAWPNSTPIGAREKSSARRNWSAPRSFDLSPELEMTLLSDVRPDASMVVLMQTTGSATSTGPDNASARNNTASIIESHLWGLTPKLSRAAQWSQAHGNLYLPCARWNE